LTGNKDASGKSTKGAPSPAVDNDKAFYKLIKETIELLER
jgi:hypothetical protein